MMQTEGLPLFDAAGGEKAKAEGMEAGEHGNMLRHIRLSEVRGIAYSLAKERGSITSDVVALHVLSKTGRDIAVDLGPAMGSLFKGNEWIFTGERVKSTRVKNHSRELKVWRLR